MPTGIIWRRGAICRALFCVWWDVRTCTPQRELLGKSRLGQAGVDFVQNDPAP
jgi:hypothetical protein